LKADTLKELKNNFQANNSETAANSN